MITDHKRMMRCSCRIALALSLLSLAIAGDAAAQAKSSRPAATAFAVATLEKFHELLAAGDSASAVRLLAPDLVVLESGEAENRADYLAHHLGADMEFAKAIRSERKILSANRMGDVAWVTSTSSSTGSFRDRKINSRGVELVVLSRSGSTWLIRAIHWSSRKMPESAP